MGFEKDQPLVGEEQEEFISRGKPEASIGQIFSASFESARLDTTLFSQVRINTLEELNKTGPLLNPEEVKKKYGLNSDRPLSDQEAIFISEIQAEKQTRFNTIDSASNSFLKGTALPFLGGIVGGLTDPLDFAVGAVTGGVAGSIGKTLGMKALGTFGIAVAENAVANTFTEINVAEASEAELQEYTAEQMFMNVAVGSLALTGVIHGIGAGARAFGRMGQKSIDATNKIVEVASEEGVDVGKAVDLIESKLDEKLKIDEPIKAAAEKTLGKNADIVLKESKDLKEFISKVNEKVAAGEITVEQATAFRKAAEENGVNKERWNLLDRDSEMTLSAEDIQGISEKLKSDEFRLNAEDKLVTENIKFEPKADPELESRYDGIDDKGEASIKEYVNDVELNTESIGVVKRYLDCLGK